MNVIEFKTLVEQLVQYRKEADDWLDTIPPEINQVFFDNPYVDYLQRAQSLLMERVFDKPLLNEVDWFMYEWGADKDVSLRTISYPDGSKYIINDIADFCDYLLSEGLLSET